MTDARFEDGGERPIRLRAFDAEDLSVISALVQDAVFPVTEIRWQRSKRRLALLLNRFRWEDAPRAERGGGTWERVQSVLAIEDVTRIATQGVDRSEEDTVLSLLSLTFEAGEDAAGRVILTLAGDGAIAADVEALEVTLQDVTRPYIAPSKARPSHPE